MPKLNLTTISATVALMVTLFSAASGIYVYVDNNYIDKHEMERILTVMQANNNELLSAFKTLGGSFYEANIIELDSTIKMLEKKEALEPAEQSQLQALKKFKANLVRDRNELNGINADTITVGNENGQNN